MDSKTVVPLLGLVGLGVTSWEVYSGRVSVRLFRKSTGFSSRHREYMIDLNIDRQEDPGLFWVAIVVQLVANAALVFSFMR